MQKKKKKSVGTPEQLMVNLICLIWQGDLHMILFEQLLAQYGLLLFSQAEI